MKILHKKQFVDQPMGWKDFYSTFIAVNLINLFLLVEHSFTVQLELLPNPTYRCRNYRQPFRWSTGHAVTQLVEALRYKPEVRGFDSQWGNWNFSLTYFFRSHYSPGVDSASNRNEYQRSSLRGKGGRCVGWTVRLCHSHNHTKDIQSTAQQMCSSRYVTKLAKWYWSNGDGCHYF